jgi:hypothetical protein
VLQREMSFPRLRSLSAEEILAVREVVLQYPYNFAQPPRAQIRWELSDLIHHARYPMARADACDKWGCKFFTIENFPRFLDEASLSEPGYLSPMTIAKLIAYCLNIVESMAEGIPDLTGRTEFNGEDLIDGIDTLAEQADLNEAVRTVSPWRQFMIAVRHPVVRWAVNNAVMNRWGADGFPPEENDQQRSARILNDRQG